MLSGGIFIHPMTCVHYTHFRLPFFPFLLPAKCLSSGPKFVKGLVFKETGLMLCRLQTGSWKIV